MQMKLLGIANVDLDIIGQRMIRSSVYIAYWRESESMRVLYIIYLKISRKPMIQLGGKYYAIFPLSMEYPGN
jgi:hypothetical protein